jgi:hypothetical protein
MSNLAPFNMCIIIPPIHWAKMKTKKRKQKWKELSTAKKYFGASVTGS